MNLNDKTSDVEYLHQLNEEREEQKIVCETAKKKYESYNVICISFLIMTILSLFSSSLFAWPVFAVGIVMFLWTLRQRNLSKFDYEIQFGLLCMSETFIEEMRAWIYS